MKSKKRTKKCFSLLLSLVLALSLLPMNVFADNHPQDQPWAIDAVNRLNDIYDDGTFTADDALVTVDAVKALLISKFSYPADGVIIEHLGDATYLTRLQLAKVVYGLYGLTEDLSAGPFSDCDDSAVITLRSLGIVSGKSSEIFAPDDTVINAELAVIFYRVLGKIGASGGAALNTIKPGEFGYDELMYLFARSCVPRDVDPSQNIEDVTIRFYYGEDNYDEFTGKEAIWNFWCSRLAGLPPDSNRTVAWTVYSSVYGRDQDPEAPVSILDAAVKIVAEDREWLVSHDMGDKTGIFSDVNPGSWSYDAVMYLFNNGIVNGTGEGIFNLTGQLTRAELAALICRIKGIDANDPAAGIEPSDENIPGWAFNGITHVIKEGYMAYVDGTYFQPDRRVTRQEAALAIFEMYKGYAAENVSLSVLDRFTDSADIGEAYKTGLAYLVSAGVVRGGADGRVMPEVEIDRASFGVLLARVMMGIDKSKMYDYETAVTEVLQ